MFDTRTAAELGGRWRSGRGVPDTPTHDASIRRADAAHVAASRAQLELFSAIAELDGTEGWQQDGARDLAHWLSMRYRHLLLEGPPVDRRGPCPPGAPAGQSGLRERPARRGQAARALPVRHASDGARPARLGTEGVRGGRAPEGRPGGSPLGGRDPRGGASPDVVVVVPGRGAPLRAGGRASGLAGCHRGQGSGADGSADPRDAR